ncbi:MAG: hypothetical protein ABR577_13985 [Pyrinomonadaceae bacterium]
MGWIDGAGAHMNAVGVGETALNVEFPSGPQPDQDPVCVMPSTYFVTMPIQVRPFVQITSADIGEDRISVTTGPNGAFGQFILSLVGPDGTVDIANVNVPAGNGNFSFNVPNLPNKTFTSIRGVFVVNGQTGTGSGDYKITVLGDYLNTCYNTPLETDFDGGVVNAGTSTSSCMWSSLNFRSRFLNEVNENGSGIDSVGVALQLEAFCQNAPPSSPPYNGKRYRRPTDIKTSCGTTPRPDVSLARGPNSSLSCGTPLYIDGIGRRVVEDRGGSVATNQLDNYRGVGVGVCSGWTNPTRKVVQLY